MKEIKNYKGYFVDEEGNVYSNKSGEIKKMHPYKSATAPYLNIDLFQNGRKHKKQIHRLVGEAFIPNPENKPEIHHKDNNPENNNVSNLQWVTRKENLKYSYETASPVRNFRQCTLFKGEEEIGKFKSIKEAARYAEANLGSKRSMLEKHLIHNDIKIVRECND